MHRPRAYGFALYQWAELASTRCNRWLAMRCASDRYLLVGGYPKSGTTWISSMIGAAMHRPVPRMKATPVLQRSVLHHHWEFDPRIARSVYVVRDGRDVMVSEYVAMMRAARQLIERRERLAGLTSIERAWLLDRGRNARLEQRFRNVFGAAFAPDDSAKNFPRFVRASLEHPFSEVTRQSWHQHVRGWDPSPEPLRVRYEAMLENPSDTLGELLDRLGAKIDPTQLSDVVDRFSFERVTGRRRGSEDRESFFRKGTPGDWRNWFDAELEQEFHRRTDDLALRLAD